MVLKSDAGENMVAAVDSISKGRFFTSRVAETVVEPTSRNEISRQRMRVPVREF